MERFTRNKLLPQLHGKIDPRQFARRGHSTTDALLFMLQAIYEEVDCAHLGARVFFADFSKGFDLIDHNILMTELRKLEVDPALISWIAAFLTDRHQAVRIGATPSDWKFLKGDVPQGTKLGVILFTMMTNNLLADWHLRVKSVDDTSATKILPSSSISLLNSIVSDIHKFSMDHNMRLNPIKCKEMLINFMLYPNFTLRPLVVVNNCIERVSTGKILGEFIDSDLRWNSHVDFISKKACKKLYSLRILRRAGVDQASMLKIYTSSVRSLLEYAVPVRQSIPGYLSDKIESIQKRALNIIFPSADSYSDAFDLARMKNLA